MLGLYCCAQSFCSCGEPGLLSTYVAQASYCGGFSCFRAQAVALMGFSSCDSGAPEPELSSCGTRAQLPCSMWDIPRPGIELVSATLQGGFLTTGPPGKPPREVLDLSTSCLNMCCLLKTIHPIIQHDRGDLTLPHPVLMSVSMETGGRWYLVMIMESPGMKKAHTHTHKYTHILASKPRPSL